MSFRYCIQCVLLVFLHHVQEWRAHYDQMHSHQEAIETKLADTKVYLDKLQQEIGRTLEKITSREKYVNNQVMYVYV